MDVWVRGYFLQPISSHDAFLLSLIVIAVGLVVIVVLVLLGAVALRIVRGGTRRHSANAEEARLMQEIYLGLEKLNDRVDSLETILLDERDEMKTV